jgi:PadR family transcriptional regulator, regulatory protein PadR
VRGHGRGRGPRNRRRTHDGDWAVRARVERFAEPAALLLLRERPMHGYELLELLPPLVGESRLDVGNLYRFLRALEDEGVVASEWSGELPGPAKRTYRLTPAGEELLATWAEALGRTQELISTLLQRYDAGKGVNA